MTLHFCLIWRLPVIGCCSKDYHSLAIIWIVLLQLFCLFEIGVQWTKSSCGTVCKTVRPMVSDRCLSCAVLSVTLVYCGQTVGWIQIKLGMEVGLGPGDIVRN